MKNIKQNNLSLKALQAEIEQLKSTNHNKPTNKFIGLLPKLWIFGLIINYFHKIPIISKIIKVLSLWYGRTTWWKMLVYFRKFIIVINAVIGVVTIFSVVGFDATNILAYIHAVGYSYYESLLSIAYRLYNWLLNILNDTIPKPTDPSHRPFPKYPSSRTDTGGHGDITGLNKDEESKFSLRSLYKDAKIITSDWNLSTWLWYGGIAILGAGAIYFGYIIYTDPKIITGIFTETQGDSSQTPTQSTSPKDIGLGDNTTGGDNTSGGVSESLLSGFTYLGHKISVVNKAIVDKLNPFNYFTTSDELKRQFTEFMRVQNDYTISDRRLYPFTEHNPFDPWYKKVRLSLLGETTHELRLRNLAITKANLHLNELLDKGKWVPTGSETPNPFSAGSETSNPFSSGFITPLRVSHVGLGTTNPSSITEMVNAVNLENALKKIVETPSHIPGLLPQANEVAEWSNHVKGVELATAENKEGWVKSIKTYAQVASSSKTILDDLDDHNNPFDASAETNI